MSDAIRKIWVTDTLPQRMAETGRVVIPVAPMIAAAIQQLRPQRFSAPLRT